MRVAFEFFREFNRLANRKAIAAVFIVTVAAALVGATIGVSRATMAFDRGVRAPTTVASVAPSGISLARAVPGVANRMSRRFAQAGAGPGGPTGGSPTPSPYINPIGATSDGNGNWYIVDGQWCEPAIAGGTFPSNTTYAWAVEGNTMQEWSVSADHTYTTMLTGIGESSASSLSYFWNETETQQRQISCYVSVPAAGGTPAYSYDLAVNVTVVVPTIAKDNALGGVFQVNSSCPNEEGLLTFYAGGTVGPPSAPYGMQWTCNVSTPQTPIPFGTGQLEYIQLESPNHSWTDTSGSGGYAPTPAPGLDTTYPYDGPVSETVGDFIDNDTPWFELDSTLTSITLSNTLTTYLMYLAPGDSNWVPLAQLPWSFNGTANLTEGDVWLIVSGASVSPQSASFTPSNAYPNWTSMDH